MAGPGIEILIKTKAQLDDLRRTGEEIKKTTKHTQELGTETEKSAFRVRKLWDGFRQFGNELPVVGTLVRALINPFTLLGVAAAAAFVSIREKIKEAKEEQASYNSVVGNVRVTLDAYSSIVKAVEGLKEAQTSLATATSSTTAVIQQQIDKLAEQVDQQINVLEAQKEVEAARIERDVSDPVQRARKLRENELTFGARTLGLRGSLPGQQAALVKKQIEAEKQLQADAGAEVPDEAGLRKAVASVEADRSALEKEQKNNRQAFRNAEDLRRIIRFAEEQGRGDFKGESFLGVPVGMRDVADGSGFTNAEKEDLLKRGFLQETGKGSYQFNVDAARRMLPGAEATEAETRDRFERRKASLKAGLGALPAGVATAADIPGFITNAEATAAGVQNASYGREQQLRRQADKLGAQGTNIVEVGKRQLEATGVRGESAVNAASKAEVEKMKQDTEAARQFLMQGAKSTDNIATGLELWAKRLKAVEDKLYQR